MMSPDPALARQPEEEELMMSPDETIARQDIEEEELQASPDVALDRDEDVAATG